MNCEPIHCGFALLGVLLLASGLIARLAISQAAEASAVDQHYWRLAAHAYRDQRGLPVRIPGKYLMEDETQGYPPLFGILLGMIMNQTILGQMTRILEAAEFFCLGLLLYLLGTRWEMSLFAMSLFAAAPVLVVYNAQLTPRILGDFFLFSAMSLQVIAVFIVSSALAQWLCWIFSAVLLGLMVMTHKMTLQLHLVLLPFWWWALQAWQVLLATVAGFAFFVVMVGWRFAGYQFRAHWDIVSFWSRHWRDLGGHQFKLSPIYGNPRGDRSTCLHIPGWKGVWKHLRVVISYAPINLFLPLCSIAFDVWPPYWVIIWISVIYAWALATLFVPVLKCLGGGYLYIFNAIAPSVIYAAYLPATAAVLILMIIGAFFTIVSLIMAYQIIKARPIARDDDFAGAIAFLRKMKKTRIAVFPLQAAEAVAAETAHAVLSGGHGYGFRQLEGFFPILKRPLNEFFARYSISWVLWDSSFWPEGETRMASDGLIGKNEVNSFGRWRLARVIL